MNKIGLTLRDRLQVVADAARHRPLATFTLVGLNLGVATLSGISVGFIVPIIGFVVGDSTGGSVQGVFVRIYRTLGIQLTLETAVGGVALIVLFRLALAYVAAVRQAKLEASYVRHLRLSAYESLLGARPDALDDMGEDTTLNAIVTEARYAGSIPYRLVALLQSVFLVLAFGFVALTIAPILTVLTAVLVGGIVGLVRFVLESGYDSGDRLSEANEQVQRDSRRGIAGLREIKQFVARDRFLGSFEQSVDNHANAWSRVRRNRAAISSLQQATIALAVFTLLYVAVTVYEVETAELAAFLFAVFRAAPQMTQVHEHLYAIESNLPHAVRVRELAVELEAVAEPSTGTASVPLPIREVTFENVGFSYDDGLDAECVLEDVSFSIGEGETVALVGPSGAGKSSLAALLARFHRPTWGRIQANQATIEDFELAEWRSELGLVRQRPYVFDGTLRENLTLGQPDANESSIRDVCSAACVDEFLDILPDGLDTNLGEDAVNLSGGQRQRVAIARTLLTKPALLVLDEATSDLDVETEIETLAGIHDFTGRVPMLFISHGRTAARIADRVLTLADGQIVERGEYDNMLEDGDPYTELYGQLDNKYRDREYLN